MKSLLNKIFQNHTMIYRLFFYLMAVAVIVYLYPRGGKFKYQFQKGKVWYYDDLYAPFDFAILKTEDELAKETEKIKEEHQAYFELKDSITEQVKAKINQRIQNTISFDDLTVSDRALAKQLIHDFLQNQYAKGFVANDGNYSFNKKNSRISLLKGNEVFQNEYQDLLHADNINDRLTQFFLPIKDSTLRIEIIDLLEEHLSPNVFYEKDLTEKALQDELNAIVPYKGLVAKNTLIISKGENVEGENFLQLNSLKKEFESKTWTQSNVYWLLTAYSFLIALTLLMLLLFVKKFRPNIYENSNKVIFIFFNIVVVVLVTTLVLKFNAKLLYVIPFVILPLVTKAFFDERLGLFTFVLTILLLGFIVPNPFEFIFIQIIAGIVTILGVSELNKRANLFISVAQITLVYLLSYLAFSIIQEGNASQINWMNLGLFIINGMLTVSLVIPLIFLYEKVFGLISDETLREYSDGSNKLLKELNEKAPGTFQHSMQVANLAEASADEIGANALLVRTGAMYHDIGKMLNPLYFIENQSTGVNPHDELSPADSAQVIIDHVIRGIEIAKKNKLPDRLIDFIRTHHGTNLVYYFYKKEEELNERNPDTSKFRYPGPIPFSKETAILMICDASEAASKSLKEPTAQKINELIEKIVKGQMDSGQFKNAAITFKEIEIVKTVVKRKLNNIYHLRIEYPD